ncbi:MAG: pimeloyl-ACP methyl ester carboxylesterase [Kiritimatiellia bacterium]|jgi:pimeloyl-ACP methyl ester carboxylesterase
MTEAKQPPSPSLPALGLRGVFELLTMARWMGPWAGADARPRRVLREELLLDGPTPVRCFVYQIPGRTCTGVYVMAHGLHPLGPDHPEMDRFARLLAGSGNLVFVPFMEDYCRMELTREGGESLGRAFRAALDHPARPAHVKPGLFNVSLGSMSALRLAASPEWRDKVGAIFSFGGFFSWDDTCWYAMTGEVGGERLVEPDLRSVPAVFKQLRKALPCDERDRPVLAAAWLTYIRATWDPNGVHDAKEAAAMARKQAEQLPEHLRTLFLQGCAAEPGYAELFRDRHHLDDTALYELREDVAHIRCPVFLVHGALDNVIHHTEMDRLAEHLDPSTPRAMNRTGLRSHTVGAKSGGGLGYMIGEIRTMLRILRGMHAASRQRSVG